MAEVWQLVASSGVGHLKHDKAEELMYVVSGDKNLQILLTTPVKYWMLELCKNPEHI